MSINFEAKNRKSPFGKFDIKSRRGIGTRSCYAKVVFFHYSNQNLGNPTFTGRERQLGADRGGAYIQGVMEAEISSLRVSKSLQTTGTFELQILPTKNWKQLISPGDWLMIYMFDGAGTVQLSSQQNIDTQNLIMLGNVDRTSRSLEKDKETDKTMLRFVVSGRGMGKVFENSDIWFNPYLQKEQTLDVLLRDAGLELTGNPSTMVKTLLDIFLGPGAQLGKQKTTDLKAWQVPGALARAVGSANATAPKFYDILKQEITADLPGYKARQMLSVQSNGSLMELLKRSANELVNELYFEEVRDGTGKAYPTIVLKPRPTSTPAFENRQPAILKGAVISLQTLARTNFVEILQSEIVYEDMGKDDHTKFNLWWLDADNRLESIMNTQQENKGGASNPLLISSSIKRDGLRRYQQMMDFSFVQDTKSSGQSDTELFAATLDQLFDLHYANHLYESGTIECTGVLEAEIGKALVIKGDPNVPNSGDKVYFIEGYEHKWQFPSTWRTTFTLTHGQWLSASNIFIDIGAPGDGGKLDESMNTSYLAQTQTSRA